MNNNSLENLIKECRAQNRKAQEEIYLQYSSILFSTCLRYADSYEEAQDNFQEGFVLIFNKIDQFQFKGSFEGWMIRIMINLSLGKMKKKNRISFDDYENHLSIDESDDDDEIEQNYSYDQLLDVIQSLSPQYRQVFNLFVFEEYSHQEIAELLNISVGTSKSNLSKARKILKSKLLKLVFENEQI